MPARSGGVVGHTSEPCPAEYSWRCYAFCHADLPGACVPLISYYTLLAKIGHSF